MAREADHLREHDGAEHDRVARPTFREQCVEDAGRQRPIERRERELRGGVAGTRLRDLEAAHAQRATGAQCRYDVDREHGQEQHADRAARCDQRVRGAGDGQGLEHQRDPAQREESEPEREHVEGERTRQIARRDTPAREHPIADRGAAEHAEIVAEHERDERRQRDARMTQRAVDPAEGQRVVAGQRQVAERRQGDCERDGVDRDRAEMAHHVAVVIRGELSVQDHGHE